MKSEFELIDGNSIVIPVEYLTFPGGEVHPKILTTGIADFVKIKAWIKDSDGLITLCLLKSILDDMGQQQVGLDLGYIPYSRQDRITQVGEPLSIKVFANIINSLNFGYVKLLDPHSDVTSALINDALIVNKQMLFHKMHEKFDCYVAPDFGASKEVQKLAASKNVEFIQGYKIRDTYTGELSDFGYYGNVADKNILIVDDLCDGGGTFCGLAKELLKDKPASMSLYVTHGMFTKGISLLGSYFRSIYTTNSFNRELDPVIKCIYKI